MAPQDLNMNRHLRAAQTPSRVTEETFESLFRCWLDPGNHLEWDCLFVLPPWLKAWWNVFGEGRSPRLLGVRQGDELIGVAPLQAREAEARFIGDPDVCDCLDFIVAPGRGPEFFRVVIDRLRGRGIRRLHLSPVRADSTVMRDLVPLAGDLQCRVSCRREDVSYELMLPARWEDYLGQLTGRERHEIRRKLRRLEEAARVELRRVEDVRGMRQAVDTFLALFGSSRPDKAAFLTPQRVLFFRTLAEEMAEAGLLDLSFLDLDARPAAAVMCFHHRSTVYLYNNGYDNRFRSLSVGFLSKVLSIREAIREGREKFDLLKGAEDYKRRLGGRSVPLYRCEFEML